jgi:transposase
VKELGFRCGRYLCGNKVTLLLFDVTTLYFESFIDDEDTKDESDDSSVNVKLGLRRHGFSKDCKFKETQVVLALAASSEGIPLWYELFPGNTAESTTLKNMIEDMSSRIKADEVFVVADGAMLTKENRSILNEAGTGWILGASVKKLAQGYQEQALDIEGFSELDEGRKYRVINLESGNTLIVTYSEKKAKKDVYDRDRAIKKLLKRLDKRGEISGKTAIGNRGVSKYIELSDGTGDIKYKLNKEKIEKEARFDGLHGVETDRRVETYEDVKEVLSAYGNLWHIEDCFRVSKSDLKIRPVYHWTERRIKAHVAICFLALLMERYLECQLLEKCRIRLSAARIKAALLKVNSTIIKASDSGKLYRFPSRLSKEAREVYRSLGLKRSIEPTEITSMLNYRRRIPNNRVEVPEEERTQ